MAPARGGAGPVLTASVLHGAKSVNQLQAELAQAKTAKAAADAKPVPIEQERNAHAAERTKVSAQIKDLRARIAAADKAIKDARMS